MEDRSEPTASAPLPASPLAATPRQDPSAAFGTPSSQLPPPNFAGESLSGLSLADLLLPPGTDLEKGSRQQPPRPRPQPPPRLELDSPSLLRSSTPEGLGSQGIRSQGLGSRMPEISVPHPAPAAASAGAGDIAAGALRPAGERTPVGADGSVDGFGSGFREGPPTLATVPEVSFEGSVGSGSSSVPPSTGRTGEVFRSPAGARTPAGARASADAGVGVGVSASADHADGAQPPGRARTPAGDADAAPAAGGTSALSATLSGTPSASETLRARLELLKSRKQVQYILRRGSTGTFYLW